MSQKYSPSGNSFHRDWGSHKGNHPKDCIDLTDEEYDHMFRDNTGQTKIVCGPDKKPIRVALYTDEEKKLHQDDDNKVNENIIRGEIDGEIIDILAHCIVINTKPGEGETEEPERKRLRELIEQKNTLKNQLGE